MSRSGSGSLVCQLACVSALAAAAALLAARVEASRATLPAPGAEFPLPDAQTLRPALLGFHTLGSDWWWLQAIQYYGTPESRSENYRRLAPIMDLVVGLDPSFCYAYRFAGITIPYNTGKGWVNVDDANRILEKGLQDPRCAQVWHIPFIRGYNAFWFEENMPLAAHYTGMAAKLPGRPAYLPLLATRLLAHAGQIELAIEYAARMAESAEDSRTKQDMRERLVDLITERELRRAEAAIEEYKKEKGTPPPSVQALAARLSPPLGPEPRGGKWIYDPATGTIRSDRMEKRVRLGQRAQAALERQRLEAQQGKTP